MTDKIGHIVITVGKTNSIKIPFSSQVSEEDIGCLAEFAQETMRKESERLVKLGLDGLTGAQRDSLSELTARYNVAFQPSAFRPDSTCGDGWVSGPVGSIFIGCSPDGAIHS